MSEKGKFWMVYCEGGGSPKQKHETLDKAIDEAKRITQKEGKITYILGCIGYCEVPMPEPIFIPVNQPNYHKQFSGIGHVLGGAEGWYSESKQPPF